MGKKIDPSSGSHLPHIVFGQLIGFLAVVLAGLCFLHPADAAPWNVGVAKTVITPTTATWLSGYGRRTKPAEGKVHDLYAKALAFEGVDRARLVIVTCDLGSISQLITDSVAQQARQQYNLPRESLILNVSHTHCAPEVAAEREIFHALPPEHARKLDRYIDRELEPKLVQLIGAALKDLRPARLTVSQSSAAFAKNRRFPTDRGFVNRRYDKGIVDHQVPVMKVTDLDGKIRAVMFGYACHSTTLNFYQYCGDYAGFAQENLEQAHPGAVALFMMGCGGDQNPYPRHGPRGLQHCRRHGRELSDAVETALGSKQTDVQGPLRIAYEVVTLDLEPLPALDQIRKDAEGPPGLRRRKASYLLAELEKKGEIQLQQTCPLHAVRFGRQLLLIAISGETVVDYSLKLKADLAGPMVWVAGYCDDVFAYLPSLRVLREGGYEGRSGIVHQLVPTPFAPSVEDRVMGGIHRLVEKVSR